MEPYVKILRFEILEETDVFQDLGKFKNFLVKVFKIPIRLNKNYRLRIFFEERHIGNGRLAKIPRGINILLGHKDLWRVIISQYDYIEVVNITTIKDILVLGNGLLMGYTSYKEK